MCCENWGGRPGGYTWVKGVQPTTNGLVNSLGGGGEYLILEAAVKVPEKYLKLTEVRNLKLNLLTGLETLSKTSFYKLSF